MKHWRPKSGIGTKPPYKTAVKVVLTVAGVVAFAAAGLGLLVYLIDSQFDDMCGNDNLTEIVSPDGYLKAVTFRRDCGATTGYSTQLSILPASTSLPNSGGNVFVSREDPVITARWTDNRHLHVSGDTHTQFLHLTECQGVQITYD